MAIGKRNYNYQDSNRGVYVFVNCDLGIHRILFVWNLPPARVFPGFFLPAAEWKFVYMNLFWQVTDGQVKIKYAALIWVFLLGLPDEASRCKIPNRYQDDETEFERCYYTLYLLTGQRLPVFDRGLVYTGKEKN